jgi:hypothetical protein
MASKQQSSYIRDLVVVKTKEFKEVKELLLSSDIVSQDAALVKVAQNLTEITHALTDLQASQFIDLLITTKQPARATVYAPRRIERTVAALDDIRSTIDDWGF